MIDSKYADYSWDKTAELLAIPSPTGYTEMAAEWVAKQFKDLGFETVPTTKGGVLADLGGGDSEDALLLEAHADTLGGMVSEIKQNGRLKLTPLGGMNPNNGETENVTVITRDGRQYEGTLQLCNASIHVNGDYSKTERTWNTVEVVPDEDVKTAADTRALGIEVGDIVAFDPRTRRTASGYCSLIFLAP